MFQVSFCLAFIQNNNSTAWIQDNTYLYCWNDCFIGTLPTSTTYGPLKCMSAFQVNENLCRLLVCEQRSICNLIEVHRIPYDFDEPHIYRGRLNDEFFTFSLDDASTTSGDVLCCNLYEGTIAYIATEKGLVRWQFLFKQ